MKRGKKLQNSKNLDYITSKQTLLDVLDTNSHEVIKTPAMILPKN
jgi:hypothetical protein